MKNLKNLRLRYYVQECRRLVRYDQFRVISECVDDERAGARCRSTDEDMQFRDSEARISMVFQQPAMALNRAMRL